MLKPNIAIHPTDHSVVTLIYMQTTLYLSKSYYIIFI